MQRVLVCCIVTWISAVIGAAVALNTGEWGVGVWALNASLCAAGWLMTARKYTALLAETEQES
jgi:hypothetical protein